MNLSTSPVGQDVTIVGLDVDAGLALRMRELGLRPGAVVRVTHRGAGGRVVAVGSDRFALGTEACTAVRLATAS